MISVMEEIWKDVVGYEGLYEVSNVGSVRRVGGNVLKIFINKHGRPQSFLYKNGKRKCIPNHRLVAIAFIPNTENKPQVNHINSIITDNRVENLEWVTASENSYHGYHYGFKTMPYEGKFGYDHKDSKVVIQITKDGKYVKEYGSAHEANRKTGINRGDICSVCRGVKISAGGYLWKYKLNDDKKIHKP